MQCDLSLIVKECHDQRVKISIAYNLFNETILNNVKKWAPILTIDLLRTHSNYKEIMQEITCNIKFEFQHTIAHQIHREMI